MEQKSLSKWLKFITLGIAVCGIAVFAFLIPIVGKDLVEKYPEYSHCYYPWLIFLYAAGIPCYAVLILVWQIASNIGKDRSFTITNAKKLKTISLLAAGDAAFFFIVNIVYLLANMSHPSIALASLLVVFAGVVISVIAAALSHLIKKAADLQEQSDLTI